MISQFLTCYIHIYYLFLKISDSYLCYFLFVKKLSEIDKSKYNIDDKILFPYKIV